MVTFSEGDLGVCVCVCFYFILSPLVECIIHRLKLNPGAALEEPEHQGIRSINQDLWRGRGSAA